MPHKDDAVLLMKERIDLMEASFQREISEMKQDGADLLSKNEAVESQLSSLQDETDRLKAKVSQLDEENRRLEAAFKLHVGNMDWEYDAPDPPSDSYWIEQGYDYGDEGITDEDYIENINEHFFQEAKDQSELLRHGTFGLKDDCEELDFGDRNGYPPLIRYDRALLPHWVEFCRSMVDWQFSSVRGTIERTHPFKVFITNVELPINVLNMLRKCFRPGGLGHVNTLQLKGNDFEGSDGIEFALEIIQSQKEMIEIDYENNPVDNDEDCQQLVDAIASHPQISWCGLEGLCRGERNGHDYLVRLLRQERMKKVSFGRCGLSTNSQSTLFGTIKLHPNLAYLFLGGNKLNDKDAIHLADALRYNRTLETLSLRGNDLTRFGENILKKVIYDDSSLNALANSNHVCTIEGLFFSDNHSGVRYYNVYRNEDVCWNDGENDPKRFRARKIFHLLRNRNKIGRNALFLETEMVGDTLTIVPLALATVQTYGEQWVEGARYDDDADDFVPVKDRENDEAAELSITYELLRSWHMTALSRVD